MKKLLFISSTLLLALLSSCGGDDDNVKPDDKIVEPLDTVVIPVDTIVIDTTTKSQDDLHAIFNELLISHVSETGVVDYNGFNTERALLQSYLDTLKANEPQGDWSDDRELAFWINTYNAHTIELILEEGIPKSIQDINEGKPWDLEIVPIGNSVYTLNDIEHVIIRGADDYNEPRIHFALVCAAISCPKLLNEAYSEDNLEARLQSQAVTFINNTAKNEITSTDLKLSMIFNWFGEDFENGDINAYIRQFSNTAFVNDNNIEFLEYNWALNDTEL